MNTRVNRTGKLCVCLVLILSATGCWNLREPDQLAFNFGEGWDLSEDGQVLISAQIAVPASIGSGPDGGGGSKDKRFQMMTASGSNIYDGLQNLQKELPREVFLGHRNIILIGERMARHGIGRMLDEIIRNPRSELRSKVIIVKDGEAKDILSVDPIFDPYTQTSLTRQQEIMRLNFSYFRELLADSLNPGVQPMIPAISLSPASKPIYAGTAILNSHDSLKLAGFLNIQESTYANWITGRQNGFAFTTFIRQRTNNMTVNVQSLHSRIRARMVGDQIQADIKLTGKGAIVENNTDLNPTKPAELRIIENEFDKKLQSEVEQLIEKVQRNYQTDIFGFGEKVHQQLPKQWRLYKNHWDRAFAKLPISIHVNVECEDPGQSNSSLKK